MGRKPRPNHAEKRRAILEAAAAALAEHGRQVPLAEICRRAGVSRQTIYNRHGSKAGLFAAAIAQGLAPFPPCPDEEGVPLELRLSRYAATLLAWAAEPARVTALRASCHGPETWPAAPLAARGPALRSLAAILRRETARGTVQAPDPGAAAALFLDLVLSGPQLRSVLGAAPGLTADEIATRARDAARVFVHGGAPPRRRTRPAPPLLWTDPPCATDGPSPSSAP